MNNFLYTSFGYFCSNKRIYKEFYAEMKSSLKFPISDWRIYLFFKKKLSFTLFSICAKYHIDLKNTENVNMN